MSHLVIALADDLAVEHDHAADRVGSRLAASLEGERYRAAHETGIAIELVQTIHSATCFLESGCF